jgi:FkbM family methyltransferase
MASRIRLVAQTLLPGAAETRDLQARLGRAEAAVQHWKRRFEARAADIGRLKASVEALKTRLRFIDQRANIRKRSELSAGVLEQLLRARAVERPLLGSDVAACHARAMRLLDVSDEYRRVLGDADGRTARLERVQVEGITWWLPRDEASAGRAVRLQRQGFPLRVILQTREVALGGLMLDIGANVGRTSIPRVLLGDVRAVYAAEPEPTNYACLVQNVVEHGLGGFVMPDRVAIGAGRGEVRLQRSAYVGGHRVQASAPRRPTEVETIPVEQWPLDEWMPHVGVDPRSVSFVKVDTQGFEANVLLGARALLARPHVAWQMEVDPDLLKRAGASAATLFPLLQASFTHFIDIGSRLPGSRSRPVAELSEALDYVGRVQTKTDLLLYSEAR